MAAAELAERCALCGGMISQSDRAFVWGELIVCETCYRDVSTQGRAEPTITHPVDFGGLIVGPSTITVGSAVIPIGSIASIRNVLIEDSQENGIAVGFWIIVAFFSGMAAFTSLSGMFARDPNNGQIDVRSTLLLLLAFLILLSLAIFSILKIFQQIGRKTKTFALLITTSAGEQMRINFKNQMTLQLALSTIRSVISSSGRNVTFNTLVVNQTEHNSTNLAR